MAGSSAAKPNELELYFFLIIISVAGCQPASMVLSQWNGIYAPNEPHVHFYFKDVFFLVSYMVTRGLQLQLSLLQSTLL